MGRSRLQSEIDSKIVLAPRNGAITKADPLGVDPTVNMIPSNTKKWK